MGNKGSSSKSHASDHVAFHTPRSQVPNIVVTGATPLNSPAGNPFAPPPSPAFAYNYPEDSRNTAPPPTPRGPTPSPYEARGMETRILAGTPPPEEPPPPPPVEFDEPTIDTAARKFFSATPQLPPTPAPRELPTIGKQIFYAKDRIAQFEALNTTTNRPEQRPNSKGVIEAKEPKHEHLSTMHYSGTRFKPFNYQPMEDATSTVTSKASSAKSYIDEYPIYNPISDFTFKSGTTFEEGVFVVDALRMNFAFCGRHGMGKSTMINALRGISIGDAHSAGRNLCDKVEPFRFIEEGMQHMVLWEVAYPRWFSTVTDVYDRSMRFDKFYDSQKLGVFHRVFILVSDGSLSDDDLSFARVVHSRRTPFSFVISKTDEGLDAEARENGRLVSEKLKKEYATKVRNVFASWLATKAPVLANAEVLLISSPVIRNLLSGTTGYLHYRMDEDQLLSYMELREGCHYALENKLRKEEKEGKQQIARPSRFALEPYKPLSETSSTLDIAAPKAVQKSTILADAGFEIVYGTDDRIFGSLEPKTTVIRAGKTTFNYGFIGGSKVGKSAMINAMRGMSSKHPLAAGKSRRVPCEKFEFDDDLLKYSVTLWELHYPSKINQYFEFIDRYNVCNFTAIFVLIDGVPTDEDLSFSKIAHRRNSTVVFLSSKTDRKLAMRSRSDEIPVCDLLKQRFVDKGMARFDRVLSASAPELCGRVHAFFVSAPVFRAMRLGDWRGLQFAVHERAVFDFLKQKRMIASLLESPGEALNEGLYANVNLDTVGTVYE